MILTPQQAATLDKGKPRASGDDPGFAYSEEKLVE